jgi:hypothetical protein
MQTNRELKIAIIVGIIMITLCLVLFISNKSESNLETIDIHIYKANQAEQLYEECSGTITTDELIVINSAVKSAYRLTENDRLIGEKITGLYKVTAGDDYAIIFDGETDKNIIYREDTQYLYNFESSIYETVKKVCE